MTAPPLPESPCVRVRLDYTQGDSFLAGSRFYLSYAGAAPTGANCITLATDISEAWATFVAGDVDANFSLTEIDVLDIATDSGLSGQWTGDIPGTNSGTSLPAQCATNIEFGIARRYRGGKPRIFQPPGVAGNQLNAGEWDSAFVTAVNGHQVSFWAQIEALTVGAMGALRHVNLSYYKGFTNITNSSGRERAVPTYRATALLDPITGYSTKSVIGSQRRRRTATTY